MIVSPALPGRLDWIASDTDKATERADERLQTILGQLDEMGAGAHGRTGADDPLLAFEDAIREFAPDQLLIGLRREDRSGWQERRLLDRIVERFEGRPPSFNSPRRRRAARRGVDAVGGEQAERAASAIAERLEDVMAGTQVLGVGARVRGRISRRRLRGWFPHG